MASVWIPDVTFVLDPHKMGGLKVFSWISLKRVLTSSMKVLPL